MRHEDDRDTRVRVAREGARLLHDHRERRGPPPASADAAWEALRRRIAAGEADPLADESDAPGPDARAPRWRRWAVAAVAIAAAVALWQLGPRLAGRGDADPGHAASLQQVDPADPRAVDRRGEPPRTGPSGHVPEDMTQKPGAAPTPADPGAPDAPVGAPERPARPGPADRSAGPGASDRSDDVPAGADLARELAELRAIADALRAGQGAGALAQADAYLQAHAAGAFAPEVRLHRAEALCLLGRTADARAAVRSFERDLPDSPLRARAAAVCAAP